MGRALLLLPVLLLPACDKLATPTVDRELYREVFMECVDRIPEGPNSTVMNDLSEAMNRCQQVAGTVSRTWRVPE